MKRFYASIACLIAIAMLCTAAESGRTPVIFMIGDSTMADKPVKGGNPERGWGHSLPSSLMGIEIDNHAVNGRSTKSFIDEGRWAVVEQKMQAGDYLLVQFGHNDQKIQDSLRYTAPDGEYSDNLRMFVRAAKAKGVKPILFTPIVRRHFDAEEKLIDTHMGYTEAMKLVGEQENVPVIDLNAVSHSLIEAKGCEESKKFFVFVEPDQIAYIPKGKQDSTHLNVRGARMIADTASSLIVAVFPELAGFKKSYEIIVAQDGSGDYLTVQDAINGAPDYQNKPTSIFIREGVYRERVIIPSSKRNIRLIGEDGEKTIITYDNYADKTGPTGEPMGTFGSATVYVDADDFYAANIAFENTAGNVGQAVAVMTTGDKQFFHNCRFIGNQDTLHTNAPGKRHYFLDCYIEGTTDFIFGPSTALFDNCTIHSKKNSYVTAASTPEDAEFGYVFMDCRFTAADGVTKVYFGRPWRDYAKTVVMNSEIGSHIRPEGWHNWGRQEREETSFYAEYDNHGSGADTSKRVKWSHQLSDEQAKLYTHTNILGED